MLIKQLPIVLFCLIKTLEAAVPDDLNVLVDTAASEVAVPQISKLSGHLHRMTLKDKIPNEQPGNTEPPKSLLSLFEIFEKMEELIKTLSDRDTKEAVGMIEIGLGQILDSGARLHEIAPTIGSLPFDAKELVLAAVEKKAHTLLKLLQRVYIWRNEYQYHWFMALSYDSPWYDKEMWGNLDSFPLDWTKNLRAICEVDNATLAVVTRNKIPPGDALENFNEELLLLCVEYDASRIFKSANLSPIRLKEHFAFLAGNSAAGLLQLYQSHAGIVHLHLEELPFPEKLPTNVDGFKFLMGNGYNFLPMEKLIGALCKEGRLDILEYLQKLNPILVPSKDELIYAAENNFKDILDWARQFEMEHDFSHRSICKTLLINNHFGTLCWWIEVNDITVGVGEIDKIAELGALKVLQWIEQRQPIELNAQTMANSAAWYQHLPVLKWLYKKYRVLPDFTSLRSSTSKILDWIRSKSCVSGNPLLAMKSKGDDITYEQLVEYWPGNFELLQWVFKNAPLSVFGKSKKILSEKIQSKEMMVWLYENFNICPTVMRWAYETGNLEAIEWAIENCRVYPTENNVECAVEGGHLHIITWIHKNLDSKHLSCLNPKALGTAISSGNLEIADYLMNNVFPGVKLKVYINNNISAEKHLATFKWMHAHKFETRPLLEAAINVAVTEDLQTLEWISATFLITEFTLRPWKRHHLLEENLYKLYQWFLDRSSKENQPSELRNDACQAFRSGSLGILKVLYEKDPSILQSAPWNCLTIRNYHVHQWFTALEHPAK